MPHADFSRTVLSIGVPVGLIKSSLMSAHKFTQADLQMFAAFCKLDGSDSNDDLHLLEILGNHLKNGDESYPELIKNTIYCKYMRSDHDATRSFDGDGVRRYGR